MASSLAPFADIQARINAGALQRLANATATWNGGAAFGVIFERQQVVGMGGETAGYATTVTLDLANTPGIKQNDTALVINGAAYKVVSDVEPDESNWATLQLRKV